MVEPYLVLFLTRESIIYQISYINDYNKALPQNLSKTAPTRGGGFQNRGPLKAVSSKEYLTT